ncbi:phospholipase D-like domain-containing protein [Rhizobium phaseoli]|uniref:phospholipase D-like domain-containing protein n=1 Tax=Rhizobium phaseoli TaxID=396 RepID=UPI0007F1658E|nr:phospholipase D-like domain-containing protein [Rhizobium phaseoli]ANL33941.1 trypsin-like peptidase domain-containing protein [Rhizobium phaseoli]ANL97666.1 trypsin-like peptidase domain-containing protein [Rhizobium phaseoli]
MSNSEERFKSLISEYSQKMPGLDEELTRKLIRRVGGEDNFNETGLEQLKIGIPNTPGLEISPERIILTAEARPVMRIRDNSVTDEFVGAPSSELWRDVVNRAASALNSVIPAVGRIELTNATQAWVGTGWMIDEDIIVTNRHVAGEFSRPDGQGGFVFRRGLYDGFISSDIDFIEEEDRADRDEHPVAEVILICDDYDVAFLRVRQAQGRGPLPKFIELADVVEQDMTIVAIGYPARDPSIADQNLVKKIFGDVYEKKRLAPGKIRAVSDEILQHDCSTLGGNSGSVLIDLESGKAVGLHYGGYFDDSSNVAVPAAKLKELLAKAKGIVRAPRKETASVTPVPQAEAGSVSGYAQTLRFNLTIPVEITVRLGQFGYGQTPAGIAGAGSPSATLDEAVNATKSLLTGSANVLGVRSGYRFKNGWITDERVVVVELKAKLSPQELQASGTPPLPHEVMGFGIDVRTGALAEQLRALDVDVVIERVARPAGYKEPSGFGDPASPYALVPVKERMNAIFHVSPDAGFPCLKAFFSRVKQHLTATMYEWEVNHVSDAIERAISPPNRSLRMVTQKKGVGEEDATEKAVVDMKQRIGAKFSHVWASVRGPDRIIPNSYHIKVASRDGEEFWLSSGNWKDSNQPDIDPVKNGETSDRPLLEHNREWHAIIKNQKLAQLFQRYIEYDFSLATLHPLPVPAKPIVDMELFVPFIATEGARGPIKYFTPLTLDEELEVLPLLTPDRNALGQRIFMAAVLDAMQSATSKLYVQNQSFSYTGDDNQEMVRMLELLRQKQRDKVDVKIIFRDAADYHRTKDLEDQRALIERLKDFGLDVSRDRLKVQPKCHTKGVIIDTKIVILGSQNFTNSGALVNRDASLLVRSPKVARYFEDIFEHDWNSLAHNDVDAVRGEVLRARPGESPPPGYKKISLSEVLGLD